MNGIKNLIIIAFKTPFYEFLHFVGQHTFFILPFANSFFLCKVGLSFSFAITTFSEFYAQSCPKQ